MAWEQPISREERPFIRPENGNCARARDEENRKKATTPVGGVELSEEHQSGPAGAIVRQSASGQVRQLQPITYFK